MKIFVTRKIPEPGLDILRKKHESILEYYTRKTGYWKKYCGALTVFYIILTFLVLYQVAMYGNENWN